MAIVTRKHVISQWVVDVEVATNHGVYCDDVSLVLCGVFGSENFYVYHGVYIG